MQIEAHKIRNTNLPLACMFRFHAHVRPGFDHASRRLIGLTSMALTIPHDRMVHANRWTPEQKHNALARWSGGENINEVAVSIGCVPATLRRWRAEARGGTGPRHVATGCPRCQELSALLRLVLASMSGTPELHAVVKDMANATLARGGAQ